MGRLHQLAVLPRVRGAIREKYRAGIRAAGWSFGLGAALALAKIGAGILGGSRAAVADGIESACDTLNSVILLGGLTVSLRPPDTGHPYGHDRAEGVTAIILATVLTLAGLSTGAAILLTLRQTPEVPALFTILPILVGLPIKAALAAWKTRLAERADSSALRSEGFNDAADVLSGTLAVAGILLARLGGPAFAAADRVAALAVSAVIVTGGVRLLRGSMSELMDEAPPVEELRRIHRTAQAVPGVVRIDKVLGRRSGTGYFLDLHVEVDPRLPLVRAHIIGHIVKQRLLEALPGVRDVLTHIEPAEVRRVTRPSGSPQNTGSTGRSARR